METKEKSFTLRFSLAADIPEALWEDEDFEEEEWLSDWEGAIKPGLIRTVFAYLRSFPEWEARIRNRGISPLDEIEIVMQRQLDIQSASVRRHCARRIEIDFEIAPEHAFDVAFEHHLCRHGTPVRLELAL